MDSKDNIETKSNINDQKKKNPNLKNPKFVFKF